MPTAATTARTTLARITIPSRRALVGGGLIALAAVLTFVGASSHSGPARTHIVVARHAIGIGRTLTADDLATMSVTISGELAAHGYSDAGAAIGSTTLAPINEGELIQRSALRTSSGSTAAASSLSFPIDRERALNGQLRPGDIVDVLGTFGTGIDSRTDVLAGAVTIAQIDESKSTSISGSNRLVLTVSLADGARLLDLAHAAQVAALTLVRSAPGAISAGSSTASPLPAGLAGAGMVQR